MKTGWRRTTSGESDALNLLLSIGYHWLAGTIRKAISDSGLSTEIGILHSPRMGHEPLVYDLEELFRQPIVDRTILALSARRSIDDISPGYLLSEITARFAECEWQKGNLLPWNSILGSEIMALRKAIIQGIAYAPTSMPWTHRSKKKRP